MIDLSEKGLRWDPKPLRRTEQAEEYPIHRLPGIIGKAVQEVADYTQAPVALVAGSALSAISAAVQTHFSVRRDARLVGPAALYFLTVAESGARKSTVDNMFMKPISDWEARQRHEAKRVHAEYQRELEAWKGGEGDKPDEPAPTPRMLRTDDTSEALVAHLARYPIAAINSAEAAVIFGGHSMKADNVHRNLGLINQLWDGGPVREDRIGREEVSIESVRVTMGLMLQPTVLDSFIQKTGGLARGIGFLARFLFCQPETVMGTRFYREAPPMPGLDEFQSRISLLLLSPAATDELGNLTTNAVSFDPDAQRAWIAFHDEVEEFLGGDREYSGIKDVASKAAENAARLACCLHIFTSYGALTPIGIHTMNAACSLMRWYLDEAVRFGRAADVTTEVHNAELLEGWLVTKHKEAIREKRSAEMTVRTVRQKCPGSLRGGKRIDDALGLLQDYGRVRVTKGEGTKTQYVNIAPSVVMEWS